MKCPFLLFCNFPTGKDGNETMTRDAFFSFIKDGCQLFVYLSLLEQKVAILLLFDQVVNPRFYIQLSKSDQWSLQLGLIYLLNTDKKINRNRKERKVQKSYFFAVSKLKRHFPPVVFTPVQSNLLPDYVFLFSYSHIRFLWLASTPSGKTSRNFEEKYLFNKTNIVKTQLVINLRTPNLWTLQGDRTLACVLHAMKSSLWLAIIEENQTNIQMFLTISPFQI